MNPILAVGQIIVSVFLIIAVLMQARGVGLSSAFGGTPVSIDHVAALSAS